METWNAIKSEIGIEIAEFNSILAHLSYDMYFFSLVCIGMVMGMIEYDWLKSKL